MTTLVLSALVLLLATPALAADPPKAPTTTQPQTPAPTIQSDAVKPLTQPTVVAPPTKPATPPLPVAAPTITPPSPTAGPAAPAPKITPPSPSGGPAVSGPKVTPGAPAAGPTVPTIPTAGIPGIDPKLGATIRDANQMDRIRDLKELERLYGDPMQRGAPAGAGGDEGLPRTLGTGRLGEPSGHQGPQGLGRDCLANPQGPGCIGGAQEDRLGRGQREGSGFGQSHDRLGAPPTLGGTLGNPGGAASGDGNVGGAVGSVGGESTKPQSPQQNLDRALSQIGALTLRAGSGNGNVTDYHEDGVIVVTSERSEGPGIISEDRVTVRDTHDNTIYSRVTYTFDNGDTVMRERVEGARVDTVTRGGVTTVTKHPPSSTQPSEAPTGGAGNDGCDWAPLHGCLNPREDIRTTIRQRTTQPGINPDAEGTEGGTGSARGGSTGPEAVTNTGDGSFGVQRAGNSGRRGPYDPRDPEGFQGGVVPGSVGPGGPARRAGSDAGIDASMGALPPPPPPPPR